MSDELLVQNIQSLIAATGDDPKREGFGRTPDRFVKAFRFLTSGYAKSPEEVIKELTRNK
jgi:GTP cyclohydrolase I